MTLAPGVRLGSYVIQAHIGSGGMGDVYRARDERLGRIVAVKLLRESLNTDPEAFDRFAREAQLLASLHHPHIATVFALEESDGVRAIVQEFVDGPTLAQRLSKGPLSLTDALAIARQIADGLDAAHQRGIIHRDLKPANIKLTTDDVVKLLDFGLAKALAFDASEDALSTEATISATQARTVLGTPAYMSPEQAAGAMVDRRTDIWAFGCVLFQMLAGRPPFAGVTISALLAETMHEEPPWSALPPELPPSVLRVLRRCLRKDPKRRLRDIGDAFADLSDEAMSADPPARPARPYLAVPAWIAAGAVVGGLAVWAVSPTAPPAAAPARVHASITLDNFAATLPVSGHFFDLSRDGRTLAYVATRENPTRIWVRALDDFAPRLLSGSEGASGPFFSPDGLWVGFFANEQVKKVALAGGSPIPMFDFKGPVRGARWAADGAIIVGGPKLLRIPTNGVQEVLAESTDSRVDFRWPEIVADGRGILATRVTSATEYEIVGVKSAGAPVSTVIKGAANPIVVDDYLLYAPQLSRDSNSRFRGLFGVRFDRDRLEPIGTPFPVLDDVQVRTGGAAEVSVAETGLMVSMPALERDTRPVWIDRQGGMKPLMQAPGEFSTPRISPDGHTVALTVPGSKPGLFLYDVARATRSRVATNGDDYFSIWSPDGRLLASCSDGLGGISWRSPTGGETQQVATGQHLHLTNWSPDGRFIILESEVERGRWEVRSLDVHSRQIKTLVRTATSAFDGVASPDGRWLAYTSDETGRLEVYVIPFGSDGPAIQVSTEGGRNPEWSREGTELFFPTSIGLYSARIVPGRDFRTEAPRLLFRGQFQGEFDVARGAREFLMVHIEDQRNSPATLHLALNWRDELRRRAEGTADTRSPR